MKLSHIILLVLLAVGIAIVVSMYGDSSDYVLYRTAIEKPGKEYHVVGTLMKERPMVYEPQRDPNYFAFYAADTSGYIMKVVYNNPKPNDFERSDKIVIVGKADNDSIFKATSILLKCPSKYENTLDGKQSAR
jgi:cytochrome c-type biogenesis protein CcmE